MPQAQELGQQLLLSQSLRRGTMEQGGGAWQVVQSRDPTFLARQRREKDEEAKRVAKREERRTREREVRSAREEQNRREMTAKAGEAEGPERGLTLRIKLRQITSRVRAGVRVSKHRKQEAGLTDILLHRRYTLGRIGTLVWWRGPAKKSHTAKKLAPLKCHPTPPQMSSQMWTL